MTTPQAKYLKDYQPPHYLIPTTELFFDLDSTETIVTAKLLVKRNGEHQQPLILDSQVKQVRTVKVDGIERNDYTVENDLLTLSNVKQEFILEIESLIDPENNTALEGLYKSAGVYCTQCEAEGFRKITPFIDRPDVLSVYTVHISVNQDECPFVLSNGNKIAEQISKDGNSNIVNVTWHDPHPKPSYLFALVAGDFDLLEDEFVTQENRHVQLQLFVDKGNKHLGPHAMSSLKKSMAWDEQEYGLCYDLDIYMIVAVDFFNMGAMENKGLNVFNSKYVLADEFTATDTDYHGIEAVIAHEYFHNWTGNRVTCRDWFQLSLKEGLTVFRDQQFSADMGSEVLERISHANIMRTHQFAEDSGPMAHPIRPEKVIEMNNFYTVTVYDKGAEVIRMLHSLLGKEGFRLGMDLYFQRHDGQAVTCDDFVNAMADANNIDLSLFKNWYSQAGTPVVTVDIDQSQQKVYIKQDIPTQTNAKSLLIPIRYERLDKKTGESLERGIWSLTKPEQTFELADRKESVLVLFENFSAPVKVQRKINLEELVLIAKYASDAFCRWDAMQTIWLQLIQSKELTSDGVEYLTDTIKTILSDSTIGLDIKAQLISIPTFSAIAEQMEKIDVDTILTGVSSLSEKIASELAPLLFSEVAQLKQIENGYQQTLVAKRSYKKALLSYLALLKNDMVTQVISDVFEKSTNMTEKVIAIEAAKEQGLELLSPLLTNMSNEFKDNVLVLDKVFATVAKLPSEAVYSEMQTWSQHEQFTIKNPNRVRALYGSFIANNAAQFHHDSGRGYQFLTDLLIELDKINPQIAARMITPLLNWKRYVGSRSDKMRSCLQQLQAMDLSKDLFEKVESALK